MKYILILIPILLVAVFAYFQLQTPLPENSQTLTPESLSPSEEVANFSASFNIITNGTTRIFTDPKYHNQSDDVYIESSSPNTVRVKKTGIAWNDFFKTLPMKLTKECLTTGTGQTFCTNENQTLRFVLNGIEAPDALDFEIKPNDKLEIIYGN